MAALNDGPALVRTGPLTKIASSDSVRVCTAHQHQR